MNDKDADNLSQRLEELQILNRLATTISSTTDLQATIDEIIRAATDLTHAGQGSILLMKSQQQTQFTTLVRVGEDRHEAFVQKICMVVAGWVLKTREALLVNDIVLDDRFKGLRLIDYPCKSVLAVPIQAQANVLGVLVLHTTDPDQVFGESDLRLVNVVASQSANILEKTELLQALREENRHLRLEVERKYVFSEIIGRSAEMEKVFALLSKVAPSAATVLIQGESGTGKELIARAVHYNSPRKEKRFVAVDCGALPENLLESELFGHVKGAFTGATENKKGLFQVAGGGTLFLDEIGNTTPALQAKLLRAIQEREVRPVGGTATVKVDVRLVCASSLDLAELVRQGVFREDLYFRLKVVVIKLPPLRERRADIPVLANHFLQKFNKTSGKKLKGFAKETSAMLLRYDWPGNIRELENCLERCVILAEPGQELVEPDLLPEEISPQDGAEGAFRIAATGDELAAAVEALERKMVAEALREFGGNRTRAAAKLGLSRRGLLNKIERYGLA